jgi:hypothetical protein
MTVPVKIRGKTLFDRDYIFNSKGEILLGSEEGFFSHILNNNSVEMMIRNTSSQSYTISKNYRIEKMIDYHENEYFTISSEKEKLIIALNNLSKRSLNSRKIQDLGIISEEDKSRKTILFNEIIVHEDEKIVRRIANVIDKYQNV